MTQTIDESPAEPGEKPPEEPSPRRQVVEVSALRLVSALVVPIITFTVLWLTFDYLRDADANRFLVAAVAVVVGVGGVFLLFWMMNRVVDWLPPKHREGVRPYVFVGPALVILSVFLVYPVIYTLLMSFQDANAEGFVGLDNYEFVFTDDSMLRSLRNSLAWVVVVPLGGVVIGLGIATLADRLRRGEAVAKSAVFLPMAISFVGAAVVWKFMYDFRPEGFGNNIGLLNGVKEGLNQTPVAWEQQKPWNNLLLIVIMIWMQTGFAMVVLSAAIKAIPDELIEAARIDGASEWQVFRRIVVPSIVPTIVVVATYMMINALKVYDIVFVMGNTETNQTEVVAERMINAFFDGRNAGRGAAIAVVLFVAIIPIMIWNIRRFRAQEAIR